jgi:alpha-galactosidase
MKKKLFRMFVEALRSVACPSLGLVLLVASVAPALAQSDLSGYWDIQTANGDGTFRHTYFEFKQEGETITGRLFGRNPDGLPLSGSTTGGKIHFTIAPPPPRPGPAGATSFAGRPIIYDGTYHGDQLSLAWHGFNGQLFEGEAKRTTQQAATPPPALPLPPLKQLPDNGLVRTPPMGWNSWNKFAGKITDQDVRDMADAMVATGMSKLGYVYINIDDTWEAGRDAQGNILTNRKFPDMKALADYVHSKGLKIGIYSSPGPLTCAGYTGSFGHEEQDAKTYAAWGIDYLKYDLCGARAIYPSTLANLEGLYQKMGNALEHTSRPIVYSLCQYGEDDVWKWGSEVGGNLWRTTGDIRDSWESMDTIGFSQLAIASYARAGHWNDPDMLEVGNGGMSGDEYRTHMSLWSLLSAPLIAGNDLRAMSEDTKSILMNEEVIAIDQDPAVKPAQVFLTDGKMEVLDRSMHDGSLIVGFFNRGDSPKEATLNWADLPGGFSGKTLSVRDLWKHRAVPVSGSTYRATVPVHGVVLLRVSPVQ